MASAAARFSRAALLSAKRLLDAALDLAAPGFCRHCGGPVPDGRDPLCRVCLAAITWSGVACPRCATRGAPVSVAAQSAPRASGDRAPDDDLPPGCPRCRARPPRFHLAAAGGAYRGPLRTLVLRYKFQHDRGALGLLERALIHAARAPEIAAVLPKVGAIVPVPAHPLRRWRRGWDPVDELARIVSRRLAGGTIPRVRLLRKVRWTRAQMTLRGEERRRNLKSAFRVRRGRRAPEWVLLVDDVLTTSATASECAAALREAGARRVVVLTVARS